MAGYDPADPITALGKGRIPTSYTQFLSTDALKGAQELSFGAGDRELIRP
jgi:hypothetical protein